LTNDGTNDLSISVEVGTDLFVTAVVSYPSVLYIAARRVHLAIILAGCQPPPSEPQPGVRDPGVRGGDPGAGGPLPGLTADELLFFNDGQTKFLDIEGVPDGLGPRFNSNQCSSCHIQPAIGGTSPARNPLIAVATLEGARNRIAFNGVGLTDSRANGIKIFSGRANTIHGNSIFSNARPGIDLVGGTENLLGVTSNDSCDADSGPNNLQNYPRLGSVTPGTNAVTIHGTLNSAANSTFLIEFFSSPTLDTSGHGGARDFLGSTDVTTGDNCLASFEVTLPVNVPLGHYITSTATDSAGNTSEFSLSRGQRNRVGIAKRGAANDICAWTELPKPVQSKYENQIQHSRRDGACPVPSEGV